ncbi:MAG: hypothetical protein R2722_13580 [Tessaracoccus sp.]
MSEPRLRITGSATTLRSTTMRRVFTAAGVAPGRCGTLLARHSAASRMLAAGNACADDPGGTWPRAARAVDRYLETDTEHLRACAAVTEGGTVMTREFTSALASHMRAFIEFKHAGGVEFKGGGVPAEPRFDVPT